LIVPAILFQHGLYATVADLFGVGGRRFLDRCELAEPWRSDVAASLYLIDVLGGANRRDRVRAAPLETRASLFWACRDKILLLISAIASCVGGRGEVGRILLCVDMRCVYGRLLRG
jgi:hypothetical protein